LARTFQITQLLPDETAFDNVALAVAGPAGPQLPLLRRCAEHPDALAQAAQLLGDVGLVGRTRRCASPISRTVNASSSELAVALATGRRLLLLDEPMAGLSRPRARRWSALLLQAEGAE